MMLTLMTTSTTTMTITLTTSPQALPAGDKRPHSSTVSAPRWRKPVKVHVTTGAKPKAGDYEIAVQKVLGEAIPLYRGYLSLVTPYPGPIDEMRWAKKCWKDSCEECETRMAYSGLINRCNVWQFCAGGDVALDSVRIALSLGGVE